MKRDSIFYKLFQQVPMLLFELVPNPPDNAAAYRFDSVAVKEPKFEIDGVFLPPEGTKGIVYFCELQMQKDKQLYERIFAESSLYFYRNRPKFSDWQVVVIYLSRSTEQSDLYLHRVALAGEQVHRIYLNELGNIRQLPLWVGLLVLTSVKKKNAIAEAQGLIARANQEASSTESRAIIDMVAAIIWHRFEKVSRQEIEAMLDIKTQETRLYREGQQEGRQEGRQEGEADVAIRLLGKRFGELSEDMRTDIRARSLPVLEALTDELLDFSSLSEVQAWLAAKPQN
jgi:predicted transposase/invertase (TIGR01784 family)